MKLSITNLQSSIEIDKNLIRKALTFIPELKSFVLSVVFVDDNKISELNWQYLHHEGATDVLAFPLDNHEGEIVISAETALREAGERGYAVEGELLLYLIHGSLHLIGYDDRDPEEAKQMHNKECEILDQLGFSGIGVDD